MTAEKLRELFPNATERFIATNADRIPTHRAGPTPIVERAARPRPLAKKKPQAGGAAKFLVRVTSRRVRLLDEDNLAEKWFVDCCRYAGLIPDDSAAKARIVTTQEKVRSAADECTVIEISEIPAKSNRL